MITPKELRSKAEKSFYKIVAAELAGNTMFPLPIKSNKEISGNNFSDLKTDILPLYQHSKAVRQKSYSVDWKTKKIGGSLQSVPARIYFETLEDYLYFTGKADDYNKITNARALILDAFPVLRQWADTNASTLLALDESWVDLLKVCRYLSMHEPPHNYYLRELPIEVHSKFIEQHTVILKKLLDILLPPHWINQGESDFSSRYKLKKVQVYTQIRILDEELKPYLGYDECHLTLDDAAWLKWTPGKVFIIENKACFLSFPKVKNAVAIWGEGFKSRISKHIRWLEKTKLICWFDLDGAGFEMLNMIREHYPNAESFLMDQQTYNEFDRFAVNMKYRKRELPHLRKEERELYESLSLAEDKQRLEQERISQQYVQLQLSTLKS